MRRGTWPKMVNFVVLSSHSVDDGIMDLKHDSLGSGYHFREALSFEFFESIGAIT